MKIFTFIAFIFVFSAYVLAQSVEAEKIDEFGRVPCDEFMARADSIWVTQQARPGSKIYVIYYEGSGYKTKVWDKKLKRYNDVIVGPFRGNALNYAKGIGIYLGNTHKKFDVNDLILVDGGYDYDLELELWIVPLGAEPPKATPNLEKKDITFRKGKSPGPFDCTHAYDY
jgi:hypothetical protein